jgi:Xaa-Pro aminopeptidase
VPTERLVEALRLIKDAGEIDALRRGGRLIASVAEQLPEIVRRGLSEREIAGAIDASLLHAGFSTIAFTTIVASGPNSALPHARPTERRLESGDLVVLDFGGVLDGYCVDLTRMAAVGPATSTAAHAVAAVERAQLAAIQAVRPGIETWVIDAAARGVLDGEGLGDAFVHATGHGLGLEVHEAPRIGRRDEDLAEVVQAGMVFTIEPGAYLDGVLGVRLEDDVLVTPEGCVVLTEAPRELLVV